MVLAQKLSAFGMKVFIVTPEYVPMLSFFEKVFFPEQLIDALPLADVVVMAAPMTQQTEKVMSSKQFKAMKDTAYFINVSRGKTVDTKALVDILKTGKLQGVGLDVTDPEPLPADHVLRKMKNVIITPHVAGPSDHNRERSFKLIRNNVERFLNGRHLVNVIDKISGY